MRGSLSSCLPTNSSRRTLPDELFPTNSSRPCARLEAVLVDLLRAEGVRESDLVAILTSWRSSPRGALWA
ncbi:MAG: hypothetical protein QM516_12520, partial [Limnohabitans sp.]|nr:hypothetical protein [Limnohabitans sp.]